MSAAGSPFNGVKIGLALILLGGIPLWWAVDSLVRLPLAQLAIMAGYGLAGMGWTMLRTRRILRERPPGCIDAAVCDGESGASAPSLRSPPSSGPSGITCPHPNPLPGGEGESEKRGLIEVGAASGRSLMSRDDGPH